VHRRVFVELSNSPDPTLAYLYRRFLANQLLKRTKAGKFLEIGVGSGRFYEDLVARGFSGLCLDLNAKLIGEHRSRARTAEVEFQTRNFFSLSERFTLLVAFEVLEHYQDDLACLRRWWELLEPAGALLFSVPAHMRQWTQNDTQAGHARRYEKAELIGKLGATGFQIEEFWCYGFPILNLTYPLSSKFAAAREGPQQFDPLMTDCGKTSVSGMPKFPRLSRILFHKWVWKPALYAQLLMKGRDLGTGYLVKCRKPLG
jgi:SAM-dependent methyltransferase